MKTFTESLDEAIINKLVTEAVLPGSFEGMYYVDHKNKVHQVKKTGTRYFYYSRKQASWMPLSKDKVKTTDKSWDDIKAEVEK